MKNSARAYVLPGILVAGLILRLVTAVCFHPPLFSDDMDYVALGKSLAHGGGYQLDGTPTAYRPPGYPLLLALSFTVFGDSLVPVRIIQALADIVSCILVFALGRKLFSERAGLIAAGISALFPIQILYVSLLMTETIFTTFLLLFLLLCADDQWSWKRAVCAGVTLGAGTLIRPTMVLLPAVIFVLRWLGGMKLADNLRAMAMIAVAAAIVVAPWLVRNYEQFGAFSLTSNTGVNFWMGNHSGASGSYSFPPGNPLVSAGDEFKTSELGIQLGTRFILEHPLEEGQILARKWAHFFSVDYWLLLSLQFDPDFKSAPSASVVFDRFSLLNVLLVHVPFAAVVLLATFGFAFHNKKDSAAVLFLLLPFVYWLMVHLVFYANARYRFPIVPLLMISSAYGADMLLQKTYRRSRTCAVVFCLFALLFLGGWITERVMIHSRASKYRETGAAFNGTGRFSAGLRSSRYPASPFILPARGPLRVVGKKPLENSMIRRRLKKLVSSVLMYHRMFRGIGDGLNCRKIIWEIQISRGESAEK